MNCPYCKSPGFPRDNDIYNNSANEHWICVKCPNPVTYSTNDKKVAIWAIYNNVWYSIVYMKVTKVYLVSKEAFDCRINEGESKEEWKYEGTISAQLPSEENVTPENAKEKLSLFLTFS
jgi:hypothetical protein